MPELPEVETTARGLRVRIVGLRVDGRRAASIGRACCRNRPRPSCAPHWSGGGDVGRTAAASTCWWNSSGDHWLAVHRKMSGNLLLRPGDAAA